MRHDAELGLRATGTCETGVRGGVRRITIDRGAKRRHRLGHVGHRRRQEMRTTAADELVYRRVRRQHTDRPAHRERIAASGLPRHTRPEAIARSGNRLDQPVSGIKIVERLAQARHVDGKNAFLNVGIRPDEIQQVPLGHEAPGLSHERDEQIVRFGRDGHDAIALGEPSFGHIERESCEFVDLSHVKTL